MRRAMDLIHYVVKGECGRVFSGGGFLGGGTVSAAAAAKPLRSDDRAGEICLAWPLAAGNAGMRN